MFTGRYWEGPLLHLYYYRARYYSPQLGRFLGRDRLAVLDYEYCGNAPVNYVDAFGNQRLRRRDLEQIRKEIERIEAKLRTGAGASITTLRQYVFMFWVLFSSVRRDAKLANAAAELWRLWKQGGIALSVFWRLAYFWPLIPEKVPLTWIEAVYASKLSWWPPLLPFWVKEQVTPIAVGGQREAWVKDNISVITVRLGTGSIADLEDAADPTYINKPRLIFRIYKRIGERANRPSEAPLVEIRGKANPVDLWKFPKRRLLPKEAIVPLLTESWYSPLPAPPLILTYERISNTSGVLVPPGHVDFKCIDMLEIQHITRQRYNPSADIKLPPVNIWIIH